MDDSNLAQKIIDITREARDLKTAHQRGLGTTRFYKYSLQIYADRASYYDFVARIATDEPTRPAAIAMMNLDEPIDGANVGSLAIGTSTIRFSIFSGWDVADHTRLTVTLISSSKIGEFRQA